MLTIPGGAKRFCDSVTRRDFLKIGALGAAGLGLADLLRLRAGAAGKSATAVRGVILICLPGGPSHLETYDLKPDAPSEVRGEFRPIRTNVPGFDICEHLPLHAKIADKLAVVRNMRFQQADHQLHEVFTGYPGAPQAPFQSPPVKPAFGSVVSKLHAGERSFLPRYISLGRSDHPYTVAPVEVPLFLGPAHAPFEPTEAGRANLQLRNGLTLERLQDCQALRTAFDGLRRQLDTRGEIESFDQYAAKAFEMIASNEVRDALDISREPAHVRELYGGDHKFQQVYQFGHTWHGGKFLLARRLVEAGVPVVTLSVGGWDDHGPVNAASPKGTIFERMREKLPLYDRSIHALVTDLHQRGLDRDVAVLVWGEFGRTPRVNFAGGRDHWPPAGFALFAGGGFRTGQVIGRTNERGERPVGASYGPQNAMAMLYHALGINAETATYTDPTGRPTHVLSDAAKITALL